MHFPAAGEILTVEECKKMIKLPFIRLFLELRRKTTKKLCLNIKECKNTHNILLTVNG